MKVRNGFVSNSSSSSFVCDVTGGVESGMDLSACDLGMRECVNGHTFYEEYLIQTKKTVVVTDDDEDEDYGDEDEDYDDSRYSEVSADQCPICTMTKFKTDDLLAYVLKQLGKNKDTIGNEIRGQFDSYPEFQKYLK